MILALSTMKLCDSNVVYTVLCLLLYAVPICGITVVGEGSTATERTTDTTLRCQATDLVSDDELVRVTWYTIDKSHRTYTEIFSADLTNDQPDFQFFSNWAGRGTFDSTSLASIRLPSRYVTREIAGNYRCEIISMMSRGFDDVYVNVLYGPGSSIIITPGGRVERQEGEELTLSCSSQCNPDCSYRWYKAGRQLSVSAAMVMTPLTSDKAGLYACQARNEVGRSIKPVDLRVFFPAMIVDLNITTDSKRDNIKNINTKTYDTLESSESVVITCKVRGWPEPSIDWSINSVLSNNASIVNLSTQDELGLKSSRYEIKSATCSDNAEYSCKTWNSLGVPSTKTVVLNISCAPFETNHSRNCLVGNDVNLIRNMYTLLNLSICFFGSPTPQSILLHAKENTLAVTTYVGSVKCDLQNNHCESVFDFNITSPEQYGSYRVKVLNSQGYFDKLFTLSSQQAPLLPYILLISNISHNSACFSWKSNFNGGGRQTFTLNVHSLIKENEQQNDVGQSKQYYIEEDETRTRVTVFFSRYSQCVTNLQPSTHYEAVLTTSNIFGISESSLRHRFTTETFNNYTIPIPSWLSVVRVNTVKQTVEETAQPTAIKKHVNQIGQLILREQTPDKLQSILSDVLDSKSSKDNDVDNDNNDSSAESTGNQFSKFFETHFALNTFKKYDPLTLWNKSDQILSNDTSHVHRLFPKYSNARNQEARTPPITNLELSSIFGAGVTTSEFLHDTPITTHIDDSVVITMSSLSPATLSSIFAGAACILGVVMTFCCITFYKRQYSRKHCKRRCCQMSGCRNKSSVCDTLQQQLSRVQTTSGSVVSHQVPSINCVYNENVSFSPSAARRPRLSTPDRAPFRTAEKLCRSLRQDVSSSATVTDIDCHVPTITLESTRISCPSYLELYHDEETSDLQDSNQDGHPTVSQIEQQQHLRPPSSSLSYSSLNQTYVKNLSDEDGDLSTSYLDLYETLTSRSRSRSPSNIYNPLFFDVDIKASSSSDDYLQHVQFSQQNSHNRKIESNNNNRYIVPDSSLVNIPQKVALNQSDQTECVKMRPKNTTQRLNKIPRSAPYLSRDSGTVSDGSYELVDPVTRKHLASYLYLPMTSLINSENSPYELPVLSECLPSPNETVYQENKYQNEYETTLNNEQLQNEDNKYDSCISLETKINDSQNIPKISQKTDKNPQYLYTNENFHNKNTNLGRNDVKKARFLCKFQNEAKNRNQYGSKTCTGGCAISNTEISKDVEDIHEINGYVEEYTISALARDSVTELSTIACSTYCNQNEASASETYNVSKELKTLPLRTSSSESSRRKKYSRRLGSKKNVSSRSFEVLCQRDSKVETSSRTTSCTKSCLKDGRDSGVSVNYTHGHESCKNNSVCSCDSSNRKTSSSSEIFQHEKRST